MDVELLEIRDFLSAHPPFDVLSDEVLDGLPRALRVRYLRRGSAFPPDDAEAAMYLLRSGAVELRDEEGRLLEKLAEGEAFSARCLDDGDRLHGRCSEDCLLYLLPCATLARLRDEHPAFNRHFQDSLQQRLRQALTTVSRQQACDSAFTQACGDLISQPPLSSGPDITIQAAAGLMTEHRHAALLIMQHEQLLGLVTDKDLRSRCLAVGLDSQRPIRDIMSTRLHTIDGRTPVAEALVLMTRTGIHHLPVVDGGKVIGLLSSDDLLRQRGGNIVHWANGVEKAAAIDELVRLSADLAEQQQRLLESGIDNAHIGQLLASQVDALCQRLLVLAEAELGPPPIPYLWLACGSHGRREATLHSDQDNALILHDDYQPEAHAAYFQALAAFTNQGLERCGFPACPGEVMANNPQWRQPVRVWREYFRQWIERPEAKAMMLASNFFDLRPVHGDTTLFEALHAEVVAAAAGNRIFLTHLAANALKRRPPLGFFRQFVLVHDGEHDDSFDIKLSGVVPIVELARLFALATGSTAIGTQDRLQACAGSAVLSREGGDNLMDALSFIAQLRLRHQLQQHREGQAMDNFLRPDALSALERSQLKDAFAAVRTVQEAIAQRYQTERIA